MTFPLSMHLSRKRRTSGDAQRQGSPIHGGRLLHGVTWSVEQGRFNVDAGIDYHNPGIALITIREHVTEGSDQLHRGFIGVMDVPVEQIMGRDLIGRERIDGKKVEQLANDMLARWHRHAGPMVGQSVKLPSRFDYQSYGYDENDDRCQLGLPAGVAPAPAVDDVFLAAKDLFVRCTPDETELCVRYEIEQHGWYGGPDGSWEACSYSSHLIHNLRHMTDYAEGIRAREGERIWQAMGIDRIWRNEYVAHLGAMTGELVVLQT